MIAMKFLLFSVLSALLLSEWTNAQEVDESILVLGDSLGYRANNLVETVCDLSNNTAQVRNPVYLATDKGTAEEWATTEDISQAFDGDMDYAYVWLSIGTYDMIDGDCNLALQAGIANNVATVVGKIVNATDNENLKIMLLDYIIPSEAVCDNDDDFTETYFRSQTLATNLAIRESGYMDYVDFVDITDRFITDESEPLSDGQYFSTFDPTELNGDGYTRLLSSEPVQEFFGCFGSLAPSASPSALPTTAPPTTSLSPSVLPSTFPSALPSALPSAVQSALPSASPSESPSAMPTKEVESSAPSESPAPTTPSSVAPTSNSSTVPSLAPTTSFAPSANASAVPSALPTTNMTAESEAPSMAPAVVTQPTSSAPSVASSESPTSNSPTDSSALGVILGMLLFILV